MSLDHYSVQQPGGAWRKGGRRFSGRLSTSWDVTDAGCHESQRCSECARSVCKFCVSLCVSGVCVCVVSNVLVCIYIIYTCLFSKCVCKITTLCSKTWDVDGSEFCTVSVKVEKERVPRSVMRLVTHLFLVHVNLPKPAVMRKGRELKCCFTSTETVGLLGMGAQDVHLDFHTAPELCPSLAFRRPVIRPLFLIDAWQWQEQMTLL